MTMNGTDKGILVSCFTALSVCLILIFLSLQFPILQASYSQNSSLFTSSTSTSTPLSQYQNFTETFSSSPNSSQWAKFSTPNIVILSVIASNTGVIAPYPNFASLNSTVIGQHCVSNSTITTSCPTFIQTGWWQDRVSEILYVHYLGGPDVKITVIFQ